MRLTHIAFVSFLVLLTGCAGLEQSHDLTVVRVNLVGYLPADHKVAVLSASMELGGTFTVGGLTGEIGPDQGPWGPFAHNYRLDFTRLTKPGTYVLQAAGAESPAFRIDDDVYDDVLPHLRAFLSLQRCGSNPVTGKTCHQEDGIDTTSGERVDLVGGWHDAGDGLKHMITTSYCVAALQLAGEEDEARWGLQLIRKLNPEPGVLYVQIGDDRDHVGFRLWHEDRADYGWGPGRARAAWRATGSPEGPRYKNASSGIASLAGRCAAALALGGEIEKARALYEQAKAQPGSAHSVPVKAPYYYCETTWHDDLEWAAAELFRATGEEQFLEDAAHWAALARDVSWMGQDEHGHYEFFPYVNLGHWRLHTHADAALRRQLEKWYAAGLEQVRRRAEKNPYRLGTPLVWCSTNDVIALATQAVLYQRMTGDPRYRSLATEARDWIFGRNPWGFSMVTGVPEQGPAATHVHHPFHTSGSPAPKGGLVDGPIDPEIHETFKKYIRIDHDPLAPFQSGVAVYHDAVADFTTNEPILDGTVSLLLLLRLW